MANLLWIQAGACSGDTMSFLNAEAPTFIELLETYSIKLLWHPSLSPMAHTDLEKMIDDINHDRMALDVLCIEGAILQGPDGSGLFDKFLGRPKRDVISELCQKAAYVVAIGTCSSFGGIPAAPPNPTDAVGLQWFKGEPGGLLAPEWKSKAGLPVINLSGCPVHPHTITQSVVALLIGAPVLLDHLNRPEVFYSNLIHQGCTRNERHEYDDEGRQHGSRGCLFFNLGCQGPNSAGSCNTVLWNGVSSKTRAGVPCLACTSPFFPRSRDLFKTDKIGDIPVELPLGVSRPHYMAYKGLAGAAKPKRLI